MMSCIVSNYELKSGPSDLISSTRDQPTEEQPLQGAQYGLMSKVEQVGIPETDPPWVGPTLSWNSLLFSKF